MKQPILSKMLSEKVCRRLLLYFLLPILTLGFGYIVVADDTSDSRIVLSFRVPPTVSTHQLQVFEKVSPAVVLIKTFDENKKLRGSGTGFFINKRGYLITNHHVISGAHSAIVETMDGKVYPVEGIIAKDPVTDIAKLMVDVKGRDIPVIELAAVLPSLGDKTVVIGHPRGCKLTLSQGLVRAGSDDGRISTKCVRFEISAPVSPGSSGSPVLNTDGQVIGIAQSCRVVASYEQSNQGVTYAVAVSNLLSLKAEEKLISLSEYADIAPPVFRYPRRYSRMHPSDFGPHHRAAMAIDRLLAGL